MAKWRMIGAFVPALTCALGILLVFTGDASSRGGGELKTVGLEYRLQEFKQPRVAPAEQLVDEFVEEFREPDMTLPEMPLDEQQPEEDPTTSMYDEESDAPEETPVPREGGGADEAPTFRRAEPQRSAHSRYEVQGGRDGGTPRGT